MKNERGFLHKCIFNTVVILNLHSILWFKTFKAVICTAAFGPFQACPVAAQGRHFSKLYSLIFMFGGFFHSALEIFVLLENA